MYKLSYTKFRDDRGFLTGSLHLLSPTFITRYAKGYIQDDVIFKT